MSLQARGRDALSPALQGGVSDIEEFREISKFIEQYLKEIEKEVTKVKEIKVSEKTLFTKTHRLKISEKKETTKIIIYSLSILINSIFTFE